MRHANQIQELAQFKATAEPVGDAQMRAIHQQLLEQFFPRVKAATGKWVHGRYRWHAYSFEFEEALSGEAALDAYHNQEVSPFYAYFEFEDVLLACQAESYPDLRPLENDIYIFPQSLGWLFITTHENSVGLGPYFAYPSP